jgi:hypothetical protein
METFFNAALGNNDFHGRLNTTAIHRLGGLRHTLH